MLLSNTLCLCSCEGDPTSKCSGVCKALTSGVQYGGKDTQLFLLPTTPRERPRNTVPRSRITPLSGVKKRAFRSEEGRLLGIQRKRERGREGSSREHTFCPVSSRALLRHQPRLSMPPHFLSPMHCFLLHSVRRREKVRRVVRCVGGCDALLRLCARVSLWVSGFLEGSERFVPSVHDQRVLPTGRKSDLVGLEERNLHCFESRTHNFLPNQACPTQQTRPARSLFRSSQQHANLDIRCLPRVPLSPTATVRRVPVFPSLSVQPRL